MSAAGAYTAFTCAIVVWGWLEMSFLMGFITGPRKHACLECCSGWRHFLHASQAIIFNELATLAGAVAILAATDSFKTTAYALMASLLTLAVLEHWFMVIPLPSEKMWKWAMRPAPFLGPGAFTPPSACDARAPRR